MCSRRTDFTVDEGLDSSAWEFMKDVGQVNHSACGSAGYLDDVWEGQVT